MAPRVVRVLVVAPGAAPEIRHVQDVLAAYQAIVGGYLEPTYIDDDLVLLYNEEGRVKALTPNRLLYLGDGACREIVGTLFFVGRRRSDFLSLDDVQLERVYAILAQSTTL